MATRRGATSRLIRTRTIRSTKKTAPAPRSHRQPRCRRTLNRRAISSRGSRARHRRRCLLRRSRSLPTRRLLHVRATAWQPFFDCVARRARTRTCGASTATSTRATQTASCTSSSALQRGLRSSSSRTRRSPTTTPTSPIPAACAAIRACRPRIAAVGAVLPPAAPVPRA